MNYNDDGITLDYDKLKDSYPAGRGWARFLKHRMPKIGKDDFIYYGKHKGSKKAFNPPVITDAINITSKSLLTNVLDFQEEEFQEQSQEQKGNTKLGKGENLDQTSKNFMLKELQKEHELFGLKKEEKRETDKEAIQENDLIKIIHNDEDYSKEINMQKDETLVKKVKKIRKRNKEKRTTIGKKDKERELLRRGIKGKKFLKGTGREKKEEQVDNYLSNRIPTFLGEYETKNMYTINRMFYFDPLNPTL